MKMMHRRLSFIVNYRYMRVIVFFDLPVLTAKNRRDYRLFRKYLIKSGFLMMQESVYCKLAQNSTAAEGLITNVRKNSPEIGVVQALTITEKQYSRMDYIVGGSQSNILDSDERLVVL